MVDFTFKTMISDAVAVEDCCSIPGLCGVVLTLRLNGSLSWYIPPNCDEQTPLFDCDTFVTLTKCRGRRQQQYLLMLPALGHVITFQVDILEQRVLLLTCTDWAVLRLIRTLPTISSLSAQHPDPPFSLLLLIPTGEPVLSQYPATTDKNTATTNTSRSASELPSKFTRSSFHKPDSNPTSNPIDNYSQRSSTIYTPSDSFKRCNISNTHTSKWRSSLSHSSTPDYYTRSPGTCLAPADYQLLSIDGHYLPAHQHVLKLFCSEVDWMSQPLKFFKLEHLLIVRQFIYGECFPSSVNCSQLSGCIAAINLLQLSNIRLAVVLAPLCRLIRRHVLFCHLQRKVVASADAVDAALNRCIQQIQSQRQQHPEQSAEDQVQPSSRSTASWSPLRCVIVTVTDCGASVIVALNMCGRHWSKLTTNQRTRLSQFVATRALGTLQLARQLLAHLLADHLTEPVDTQFNQGVLDGGGSRDAHYQLLAGLNWLLSALLCPMTISAHKAVDHIIKQLLLQVARQDDTNHHHLASLILRRQLHQLRRADQRLQRWRRQLRRFRSGVQSRLGGVGARQRPAPRGVQSVTRQITLALQRLDRYMDKLRATTARMAEFSRMDSSATGLSCRDSQRTDAAEEVVVDIDVSLNRQIQWKVAVAAVRSHRYVQLIRRHGRAATAPLWCLINDILRSEVLAARLNELGLTDETPSNHHKIPSQFSVHQFTKNNARIGDVCTTNSDRNDKSLENECTGSAMNYTNTDDFQDDKHQKFNQIMCENGVPISTESLELASAGYSSVVQANNNVIEDIGSSIAEGINSSINAVSQIDDNVRSAVSNLPSTNTFPNIVLNSSESAETEDCLNNSSCSGACRNCELDLLSELYSPPPSRRSRMSTRCHRHFTATAYRGNTSRLDQAAFSHTTAGPDLDLSNKYWLRVSSGCRCGCSLFVHTAVASANWPWLRRALFSGMCETVSGTLKLQTSEPCTEEVEDTDCVRCCSDGSHRLRPLYLLLESAHCGHVPRRAALLHRHQLLKLLQLADCYELPVVHVGVQRLLTAQLHVQLERSPSCASQLQLLSEYAERYNAAILATALQQMSASEEFREPDSESFRQGRRQRLSLRRHAMLEGISRLRRVLGQQLETAQLVRRLVGCDGDVERALTILCINSN